MAFIAGYKKPRIVELVEALPRNNTGKVDKNEMRRIFFQRHPGRPGDSEGVGVHYQ